MRTRTLLAVAVLIAVFAATAHAARVLRVGNFKGRHGTFSSIQAAVDAAKPGDWVLVAPGDWHERADHRKHVGAQGTDTPAGVVIAKPRIHLRGMDRNRTIVDGTLPGRGGSCSRSAARQDLG